MTFGSSSNSSTKRLRYGRPLTFYRQGDATSGPDFAGFAYNDARIYMSNYAFTRPDWTQQVVFHEVGHLWDESGENSTVDAFRQLSSWEPFQTTPNHVSSSDGQWWHGRNAQFAREYGRTNPMEDYATAWAAFWMDQAGLTFSRDAGQQALVPATIAVKLDNIRNFVFSEFV